MIFHNNYNDFFYWYIGTKKKLVDYIRQFFFSCVCILLISCNFFDINFNRQKGF